MAKDDDEVGVKVEAQLDAATGSGNLAVSARSRFAAAVDRLFGGIFDLPAAKIDVRIEAIKHEAELRRRFREAQAAPILEALEAGDNERARLLQISAASHLRELDKTLNLAGVVSSARLALTDQSKETSSSPEDVSEAEDVIDDEWLTRFQTFASTASSDKMRNLWGRVLAGEAKSPGSFSAASLRFIFDLDKTLAATCERVAKKVVNGSLFQSDEDLSGRPLSDLLALQAAGLLAGVGANLTMTMNGNLDEDFSMWSGKFAIKAKQKTPRKLSIRICSVTQLGLEIFSLLPSPDVENNFRSIGQLIVKKESGNLKELSLFELGNQTAHDTFNVVRVESLMTE